MAAPPRAGQLGTSERGRDARPGRCSSSGERGDTGRATADGHLSRHILGGNGISGEYSPLRHANNLESVRTYEGTDEVHTLVVGQALTGQAAYR